MSICKFLLAAFLLNVASHSLVLSTQFFPATALTCMDHRCPLLPREVVAHEALPPASSPLKTMPSPTLASKETAHMFDENEGANERDGSSCAMMMFAYLAGVMLVESFMLFSSWWLQWAAFCIQAATGPCRVSLAQGLSVYFYGCT
jgi:hypothetical protein